MSVVTAETASRQQSQPVAGQPGHGVRYLIARRYRLRPELISIVAEQLPFRGAQEAA